jgi:uncharacterized Fe-S radical SAM superfamily protein PflX
MRSLVADTIRMIPNDNDKDNSSQNIRKTYNIYCQYVGSIVNDSNSNEEEIKERISLGTKAYHANQKFFNSRLVTKYSKLKLYRTVIRPIVTYASETWVLKETIIQKLLVF